MEGDNIDRDKLKVAFETYSQHYKQIISQYRFMKPINLNGIISSINKTVNRLQKEWTRNDVAMLPELLAKIFAVWTLMDLKDN